MNRSHLRSVAPRVPLFCDVIRAGFNVIERQIIFAIGRFPFGYLGAKVRDTGFGRVGGFAARFLLRVAAGFRVAVLYQAY